MELFVELGPLVGIAIVGMMAVTAVLLIPVYGITALCINLHDRLLRDDAEHFLRNKLTDLRGWEPNTADLGRFLRKELASPNQIGYDLSTLQEFVCYLVANAKSESSLVVGTNDENTDFIWLRFHWKDEWWVLWYDSEKAIKNKNAFRAFPESCLESEVYQEIGLITKIRTISYAEVLNYWR